MKLTTNMLVFLQMAMQEQGKRVTPKLIAELEAQEDTILSRALYFASYPEIDRARLESRFKKEVQHENRN